MFRWKATAAVLAIAALTLSGCASSGSDSSNGDGAKGETLTLGAITEPLTLDPAGAEWGNRSPYYQAMYDTLLRATPEGTIDPWLATEWSYNDDNTELTMTIRDDVTFSDGSALDAEVVVENLQRFKDGTSPDASYFAYVDSFAAPDATTVVITLTEADPALLSYLTRDAGLIASSDAIASGDLATNPVGSGPYIYDASSSVSGTSYVYTANPDYWNPDVQHYNKLVINVLADATASLNAIKAGEANVVKVSSNDNLAEIEAAGWTINSNELDFAGLLLLDRSGEMNEALGDVRVRQAINYAFDREGLLEGLEGGNGTVTEQVFPASSAAYNEDLDTYYDYDPDKARELLAEAGYADGFTLSMPSSTILGSTVYTLVEQQLADIGITAEYTEPGSNFISDLIAPKYPASYMTLEQNPDWQLIQFMVSPSAIFNPFHSESDELNTLIAQFQAGDEAAQDDAASQINEYLVENAWFAPWYRVQGNVPSDANTTVEMLPTNAYPAIYDIYPTE
ncbi:peptide/nickel transport system substrate-binding protein [Microbacterium halimionae]|uniref:Peptide/nickel transport system substrate-binding protein n=1 Tax=Microbacterium halimionae TaxID=1526413 RepID=A0A7W3JLU5_9MICO|nr:ABC transporter substrate-binding protein [Microbacterium halimionae]MBA8815183.1 peptide/nickel transport system substrate-binding protein [Microbacterium halimionae]NII94026.1 peptide/nickel transport system substrate-binding protein [Microbacterium halimionae]